MTKKTLPAAIVLSVALAAYLHHRFATPHYDATTFDGSLAKLDFPLGWDCRESQDEKFRYIEFKTKSRGGELADFELAEFPPRSGNTDAETLVKKEIEGSFQPGPIAIEHTMVDGNPAQEFSVYIGERIDSPNAFGVRVYRELLTEIRVLIFVRRNGDVCEISYMLPRTNPEEYRPIFKQIVASIRLK